MGRLDSALVERGLCESREKAKRAILAGQVTVNGQTRPQTQRLGEDGGQTHAGGAGEVYVSRGGHKLEHALGPFRLDVAGQTAH